MKKFAHWWVLLLNNNNKTNNTNKKNNTTRLPDIGDKLQHAALRQAVLASVYMNTGVPLLNAVPSLDAWGQQRFKDAVYEGFPRIHDDPSVAFDLIFSNNWNTHHRMLRVMYWAPPLLAVLWIVFWVRRPKKDRLMNRR